MILGIAAELSAPPSSPTTFREVTMFGCSRGYDVLAYCDTWEVDSYWHWFRRYGLFDYVADLLPREQIGPMRVEIEGGCGAKLTVFNLHDVLRFL